MRQITQCFTHALSSIYKDAEKLKSLTALVQTELAALAEPIPCHVSRFSAGILVLAVEDAVFATKLRYELPRLRDQLRKAGLHQLTSIRIYLSPGNIPKPFKKQKKAPVLSNQAKQTIRESARHCHYGPLKDALERLGEHQASAKETSSKKPSSDGLSASG